MKKCKIIAYEGPDRVGKATQSTLLCNELIERGFSVKRVEVPVEGFMHKKIYDMLENGNAKKYPYYFQFIQFLNRFVFQIFTLPKLLAHNDYVIFDRWSGSSWVYGLSTNLNVKFVEFLLFFMVNPDVTFVLNGKPQVQIARDYYENDFNLQTKVRIYYDIFSEKFSKKNVFQINANQNKNVILEKVLDILNV